MDPIIPTPLSPNTSQQILVQEKAPNQTQWEAFFSQFDDEQKKQFMRNLNLHLGRVIRSLMRKQREAAKKLRESHREK